MVKKLKWVHKITLPDGTTTPGIWEKRYEQLGLTNLNFRNKRVLDVGCLNGEYTFFAEKNGAKEVLSIDITESKENKKNFPQAAYTNEAYLTAHRALNSKAKYIFPYSIYDVDTEEFGKFDIVLFLGVLYHLAHPLLALEKINKVLKIGGKLVIESEISRTFTQFYNKNHLRHKYNQEQIPLSVKSKTKVQALKILNNLNEKQDVFNKDNSVFWVPTATVLERFLDFSGFKIEKKIDDKISGRISYIATKVEKVNLTYSVKSTYSEYKRRISNFDFKK